jgi:uncharacterized protein DUF1707
MDDRIRISDADRDRIAARLREHFAEGRLTADELDERLTIALSAKTFGDLRQVMADLPEPGLAPLLTQSFTARPTPQPIVRCHRLRIFPLVAIALVAAVVIPNAGWVLGAVLKAVLVAWLIACLAGMFLAARFGRRLRRNWQAGRDGYHWQGGWQGGWHGGHAHHAGRHWR